MADGNPRKHPLDDPGALLHRAQGAELRAAELEARIDELERERDAIGAALGEPCAECGHIDWRSDGYADRFLAAERALREIAEFDFERSRQTSRADLAECQAMAAAALPPYVATGEEA